MGSADPAEYIPGQRKRKCALSCQWEWHRHPSTRLQGPREGGARIPTPERLSNRIPTPKSGEQFAPLHWISERESGGSVGKYMRENASRSPLPCSAIWCWETSLMMLISPWGVVCGKRRPTPKISRKWSGGRCMREIAHGRGFNSPVEARWETMKYAPHQ